MNLPANVIDILISQKSQIGTNSSWSQNALFENILSIVVPILIRIKNKPTWERKAQLKTASNNDCLDPRINQRQSNQNI